MSLAGSAPLQSGPSGQEQQQQQQTTPSIPRLAEPFQPTPSSTSDTTPRATNGGEGAAEENGEPGKKHKKRSLFGFGKKKEDSSKSISKADDSANAGSSTTAAATSQQDIPAPTRRTTASPIQTEHSISMIPSSPGRALSSSPRLSSPAGSQIFERDVQESAVLIPNSPAIPSHITTENHIPPVLDASSEAITDDHLDPDSVEIITHTQHQPAAVTVTGVSDQVSTGWQDELADSFPPTDKEDSASNYGSFDTTDVRRLSFISFADVVQAEQQQQGSLGIAGSRESMHLAGLTSLASVGFPGPSANRSPSPIRSPVSSAGGVSPPTSKSGSVKGLEIAGSPGRKPLGSPISTSGSPPVLVNGEISIETMSQALRRTGSTDLSAVRSLPVSPIEGPSR